MKKFLFAVFVIVSFAALLRLAINARVQPAQAASFPSLATNTEYLSPTPWPTQTIIPSATIGYQDTAIAAQQTAMEAVRVNAAITAEHEQRLQEQYQLTAQYDYQNFQVQSWTATGALTSIPLTMTQQYYDNTQIANSQNIIAGQLTATKQAPTQMAAVINIRNMEKYANIDHGARAFFMIASGLFMLALVVWFVRNPVLPKPEPEEQVADVPPQETIINLKRANGQGTYSVSRRVVPCEPEQLTELAELAANGEKKFGINRLETTSRTLRGQRETLLAIRKFLIDNDLVISDATGTITLNADGEEFFAQWFENHRLSDAYEFAPEESEVEK